MNVQKYRLYNLEMFFSSYKEAHEALKIPGSYQLGTQGNAEDGVSSIKLTENPRSLDRISRDFNTIYYVGIGKKSSQGEPDAHQIKTDQAPFFVSMKKQNPVPVLIKLGSGVVMYAGDYTVKRIYRRISPRAKHYYEIQFEHV
jgi:hypothetical protein